MPFKDIFYLELLWSSRSVERNGLCNFSKGHYEEHFCEIILNLDLWFRGCHFKIFLVYSSIYSNFAEGIIRKISVNYFEFRPVVQEMPF